VAGKLFDVAVLGSGLMGAAAARHLQKECGDVLLIGQLEPADKRNHSGVFGAHYDSGRIVRILDRDPIWATLAERAIAGFEALEAESGIRFFHQAGVLYIGPADAGRSDFLTVLQSTAAAMHVPFERLDAPALSSLMRPARFPAGMAALLTRDRAGYLDPRRHILAQQTVFRANGGRVIDSIVRRIECGSAGVRIVHRDGEATARRVIVATGAFTNQIEYPGRRLRLAGERWSVLLARVEGDVLRQLAAMPCTLFKPVAEAGHLYMLPPIRYPDGHCYLKIGSPFKDGVDTNPQALSDWFRNPVPAQRQQHMRALLHSVFDSLHFDQQFFEPCCGTQTPTGWPYIEHADDPRIVWLVGCNTYAAKSADELGRLAARLLLDGGWRDSLDAGRFKACYATT
jgi:sarcosine oxidase